MKIARFKIIAMGVVQGVGFRPFVSRLARSLNLNGRVFNTSKGVEIEIEGPRDNCGQFVYALRNSPPPMSDVFSVEVLEIPVTGDNSFEIVASRSDPASAVVISPDIATCHNCWREFNDPADRRHLYPFINCTDCGPRYSIIQKIPYDRPNTSMAVFAMCEECEREYHDTTNRRFHAQPNACPKCGPRLLVEDADGKALELADALGALSSGKIVGVMGIGGFHLAVRADDEVAVARLRDKKLRPKKPLAVMCRDMEALLRVASPSAQASKLLQSPQAPIVICPGVSTSPLAPSVAPGQGTLGVFVPYSPIHKLLFADFDYLVMTSANRSDEPMIHDIKAARQKLAWCADVFVHHGRRIVNPVDDSVFCDFGELGCIPVRRARGFAPKPIPLPGKRSETLLCVGAELLNTFAIAKGGWAFVGPHVGDLKNLDTEEVFINGIGHLSQILQMSPQAVASDLHPEYRSSVYAKSQNLPHVKVQHHMAHASAVMAENAFNGKGICVILDGVGLGLDGTIWGGEVFVGSPGEFTRAAHLATIPQPGGDLAAREPWRMAAAYLKRALGVGWLDKASLLLGKAPSDLKVIEAMMEQGLNAPLTSSCGRLFDAVAGILGFGGRMTYSAQAPMELEAMAAQYSGEAIEIRHAEVKIINGIKIIDASPLIFDLAERKLEGVNPSALAAAFHVAVAKSFTLAVKEISADKSIKDVFFSGGCFQNRLLSTYLKRDLEAAGLTVHLHKLLPPNDGGISYGQAAWHWAG